MSPTSWGWRCHSNDRCSVWPTGSVRLRLHGTKMKRERKKGSRSRDENVRGWRDL